MSAERVLPVRRKRANKGRAIRVSMLVHDTLDRRRAGRSWDAFFRNMLGLPDRAGNERPLVEGMLEAQTGVFVLKLNDASWVEVEEVAYKLADRVAKQKKRSPMKPIRMREWR